MYQNQLKPKMKKLVNVDLFPETSPIFFFRFNAVEQSRNFTWAEAIDLLEKSPEPLELEEKTRVASVFEDRIV